MRRLNGMSEAKLSEYSAQFFHTKFQGLNVKPVIRIYISRCLIDGIGIYIPGGAKHVTQAGVFLCTKEKISENKSIRDFKMDVSVSAK